MRSLLLLAGYPRTGTTSLSKIYQYNPIRFLEEGKENYILARKLKTIDDYISDYRDLVNQYPDCIPADFTPINIELSEETLIELKEKAKPYFNIKVLLSLRHPVDRVKSLYYKNLEWITKGSTLNNLDGIEKRPLEPSDYDVDWIYDQIPYLTTYNKYKKHFPVLVIDGIHYLNTFYRKKELSELIEYDLPEVQGLHRNSSINTNHLSKFKERKLYKLYSRDIETWRNLCF